jgi:hypothetical protein
MGAGVSSLIGFKSLPIPGNHVMKLSKTCWAFGLLIFASISVAHSQPARLAAVGTSDLDIGQPGIAWYATWETAEAEGKRSGRPIMFVAAATQCGGVPGVF